MTQPNAQGPQIWDTIKGAYHQSKEMSAWDRLKTLGETVMFSAQCVTLGQHVNLAEGTGAAVIQEQADTLTHRAGQRAAKHAIEQCFR